MKTKLILVLIMMLVVGVGVTFGYILSTYNTNDVTIWTTSDDVESATLTQVGNYVLIPYNATSNMSDQKTSVEYRLLVTSDNSLPFTIDSNLSNSFEIIEYDDSQTYYTNVTYTISIRMLEPSDSFTFHIICNF